MTTKATELLVSGAVPYPKKILCLTFSVNAARGMRIAISSILDEITFTEKSRITISRDRFFISNYHGLSRKIIRNWMSSVGLQDIELDKIKLVDDSQAKNILYAKRPKDSKYYKTTIEKFSSAIESKNFSNVEELLTPYRQIVLKGLIPEGLMTYNGLLVIAIHILECIPSVRKFIRLLFPCIMVDEAQDMNYLHWKLLKLLLGPSNRLFLFGDPVQRIYGFLGAIPNLETLCKDELNTIKMELKESHRFNSDSLIGKVERDVRNAACGNLNQAKIETAEVPLLVSDDELSEGDSIARLANLLACNTKESVAILFKTRCNNTADGVRIALKKGGIDYFDGLFEETSEEYNSFNEMCLNVITSQSNNCMLIHKDAIALLDEMSMRSVSARFSYGDAYRLLLKAFKRQLIAEFKTIDPFDRYDLLYRTFSEHSLRNAAGYLDTKIVLMTVHASKGLEWRNVIIAAMYQYGFPSGHYCYRCFVQEHASRESNNLCMLKSKGCAPSGYEDELNAFYVAVSRSQDGLYLSIPRSRITKQGATRRTLGSCLLQIPGLKLKCIDSHELMDEEK